MGKQGAGLWQARGSVRGEGERETMEVAVVWWCGDAA